MVEKSLSSSNHFFSTSANDSATQDTEFTLTLGHQRAVVSPFGASLRRYVLETEHGEWDVIWGYGGGAGKKGGQGDVLIPFPGRIRGGTFKFEGQVHSLAKNDKDGPNAIHGFLRASVFKVESLTATSALFSYEIRAAEFAAKGFPFSLHIEVSYEITSEGLATSYLVRNMGTSDAPAGVGFHPYFRADRGELKNWTVTIPARDYVELENLVPSGKLLSVTGTKLDFQKARTVGLESYNDCLTHLERDENGFATCIVQHPDSPNRVMIRMDKTFDYVVIYTGDQIPSPNQRQGFAIEPMTCAPDAFNHDGWGAQVLTPGAEIRGSYKMSAETSHR